MRRALAWAVCFGIVAGTTTSSHAQAAARTWVSGVGDDVNPCSRAAPCRTFAGALSRTVAGGEIDCIDAGSFGTVTITQSVTIDCGGQPGGIQSAGAGAGVVVDGANIVVTLRNLSISGVGTGQDGVRFVNGKQLTSTTSTSPRCRVTGCGSLRWRAPEAW